MDTVPHRLRSKLEVDTEFGSFLGDTRIRLLEAIDLHGSKAAWDAVDAMNNLADQPLVVRSTGGKNGGGTLLTDHGRKTIALYRALEAEYQSALDRLSASMNDGEASDFKQFSKLLKRMSACAKGTLILRFASNSMTRTKSSLSSPAIQPKTSGSPSAWRSTRWSNLRRCYCSTTRTSRPAPATTCGAKSPAFTTARSIRK